MKKRKNNTIAVLLMAVLVTTAVRAVAQSENRAKIPFSFVVGGHLMPAGTYRITTSNGRIMEIRQLNGNASVFVGVNYVSGAKRHLGSLIFSRAGKQENYILTHLWTAEDPTGQKLDVRGSKAPAQEEVAVLLEHK